MGWMVWQCAYTTMALATVGCLLGIQFTRASMPAALFDIFSYTDICFVGPNSISAAAQLSPV